jgi:predicted RNA-binding Zn ribbon-like protein
MSTRPTSSNIEATEDDGDLPPPMRVGDHVALDFLNTLAAPKGTPIEWIGNGRDLLTWLLTIGVLTQTDVASINAACSPADLDKVALEAIALREWFRGIITRIKDSGTPTLTARDLKRLNGVLARDATFRVIELAETEGKLRVAKARAWRDPSELIAPIAEAMAELICEGDFDLVRKCENPPCTMWFYDRTKGHRRRWCSQTICGNRAKVAAFRERQRQG